MKKIFEFIRKWSRICLLIIGLLIFGLPILMAIWVFGNNGYLEPEEFEDFE